MRTSAIVVALCVLAVALSGGAYAYTGIGDRLLRTFLIFSQLPLDNSSASNWYPQGSCVSGLGVQYTVKSSGPTKSDPVSVYISAGGQISAFGVSVWSAPPDPQADYWTPAGDHYDIIISTRSNGDPCDPSATWQEEVGDQLVVTGSGQTMSIPLTSDDAANAEWTSGGCISKMGRHWGYDLSSAPYLSGQTANLFPFVSMYNEDTSDISAVLLQTANSVLVEPFGDFEAYFISSLFCLNFCSNCTMDAPLATMHFLFVDPSTLSCASRC
jgi:WAS/WASL-interacting protein